MPVPSVRPLLAAMAVALLATVGCSSDNDATTNAQEDGDATIIALSYEVDLEELAGLGAAVEAVDQATWVDAGGVIR